MGRVQKMRIGMTGAGKLSPQWSKIWPNVRKITKLILDDLESLGAKQVNWRLNESKPEVSPVFIDWLAVDEVNRCLAAKSKVKDIGKYRFLDPVPSKVYRDALAKVEKEIIVRDWEGSRLFSEKQVESQMLVQKAGLMHQRFIGIIAKKGGVRRCVGTLTVSFKRKPSDRLAKQIDEKMKQWACWQSKSESKLVQFVEQNFDLGGPKV